MIDPLESTPSFSLQKLMCRICLVENVKMYNIYNYNLLSHYEDIINKNELLKNLPNHLCYECAFLLLKYSKFKLKCERGLDCFEKCIKDNKISQELLEVNRKENDLLSCLSINNNLNETAELIDEEGDKDDSDDISSGLLENNRMCINENEIKDNSNTTDLKRKCNNKIKSIKNKAILKVDKKKWRKIILNEQEVFREFNKRSEKYQNALFSCDKCFQGFSNKNTLGRHMGVHCEKRGNHECGVCKKRFKWQTKLKCHMLEHTVSYHCLRCSKICNTPSQVKVHEKYHDGINYVCKMCGAKFLKMSTYYSHVRLKHRSAFICVSCGLSFVSDTGLSQHRTRVHPQRLEEYSQKFSCQKCNIHFESAQAFDNHVKRSTKHCAENADAENRTEQSQDVISCKNCEQVFKSVDAYTRHERSVHTTKESYTRPEFICEICGASIAKSSIWQHRNSHTRETVFPCNTCGRQFHTPANRHRHMVTHTGEKPFVCRLCDKSFTQRTNLKLHFNTYHLKQPYPYERNRRRKRDGNTVTSALRFN